MAELGKIRQEALKKGAWSAAVNAEVARGKAAGLYIEQKIIRTGKLDDLSEIEIYCGDFMLICFSCIDDS